MVTCSSECEHVNTCSKYYCTCPRDSYETSSLGFLVVSYRKFIPLLEARSWIVAIFSFSPKQLRVGDYGMDHRVWCDLASFGNHDESCCTYKFAMSSILGHDSHWTQWFPTMPFVFILLNLSFFYDSYHWQTGLTRDSPGVTNSKSGQPDYVFRLVS